MKYKNRRHKPGPGPDPNRMKRWISVIGIGLAGLSAVGLVAVSINAAFGGKTAAQISTAPTEPIAQEATISASLPPVTTTAQSHKAEPQTERVAEIPADKVASQLVKRGRQYCDGEGVSVDYVEAYRLFQQAADLGSADGWYWMGLLGEMRKGERRSHGKRGTYFENAARLGHIDAAFQRGRVYLDEYKAEYNRMPLAILAQEQERKTSYYDRARPWLKMAIAGGSTDAMFELGKMDRDNALCEKAAKLGNMDAMAHIGKGLYSGRYGWEKNQNLGKEYLKRAADGGSQEAQEELIRIGAR